MRSWIRVDGANAVPLRRTDTIVLLEILIGGEASEPTLIRRLAKGAGDTSRPSNVRRSLRLLEKNGLIAPCGSHYAMLARFSLYAVTVSGRAHLSHLHRRLIAEAEEIRAALLNSRTV